MAPITPLAPGPVRYERYRPEATLLYQLVEHHYPDFLAALGERDRSLPLYVEKEFEAYLKCGRLEHGFLRVRCTTCYAELLVDEVLPREPIRHWVLSVPFPLRFLIRRNRHAERELRFTPPGRP